MTVKKELGPMDKIECSFCCTSMSPDEAKGRVVAGPTVFICRDCVDMCVEVFCNQDIQWRDEKIEQLIALRDAK